MKYHHFTEQEVLDKSRELSYALVSRRIPEFIDLLDEDFVWIGDYNVQYTKGIQEFLKQVESECALSAIEISHEEYSILIHERHIWITYGRFTASASMPDSSLLAVKMHFTFVWNQHKDFLKLIHAHATHAADATFLSSAFEAAHANTPQALFFDRMHIEELTEGDLTKIRIKDLDGNVRFLFPAEILYIKSNDKLCTIYTESGAFVARTSLKNMEHPQFLHIHRSYLANLRYIQSIRRYKATLTDGTQLPIGKERYVEIQIQLTGERNRA
ncbi:LytTR family transcriptional regulator [Clostridium sp. AF19-22AC]|jgi:ketosteroid isomerase-like protein|uniref:LytTR family DNA-binding domain-containing protein n=1 Tax=Clostridia TaxID=186801 RepID=UPI000E512A82|nr:MULTISPECIES: LytTR family DNA-binding domain-containing protein [Clostridia]RHR32858.1 LytTR family transcriptional regulator [Clostridium sp. AF19-22AC]